MIGTQSRGWAHLTQRPDSGALTSPETDACWILIGRHYWWVVVGPFIIFFFGLLRLSPLAVGPMESDVWCPWFLTHSVELFSLKWRICPSLHFFTPNQTYSFKDIILLPKGKDRWFLFIYCGKMKESIAMIFNNFFSPISRWKLVFFGFFFQPTLEKITFKFCMGIWFIELPTLLFSF